jgi:diguanylate cyclase (GGDEF)-like protein/PAS domain S-box-containing protein
MEANTVADYRVPFPVRPALRRETGLMVLLAAALASLAWLPQKAANPLTLAMPALVLAIALVAWSGRVRRAREALDAAIRQAQALACQTWEGNADSVLFLDGRGRLRESHAGPDAGSGKAPNFGLSNASGGFWPDRWSGPSREAARAAVATALNGRAGRFRVTEPAADGAQAHWELVVAPLSAAVRNWRLVVVGRNISGQLRAETARADGYVRQQRALDAIGEGVLMLDERGCVRFANDRAALLLNLDAGRGEDRPLVERIGASLCEWFSRCMSQAIHSGSIEQQEICTAESRWLCCRFYPEPGGMVVLLRDVSEERLLREKLRTSELRFEMAVQASRDAIWEWDLVTGTVYRSPVLSQMLKVGEHALRGGPEVFREFVHAGDRARLDEALRAQIDLRRPLDIEFRVVDGGGETCWMRMQGQTLRDEGGRPLRCIGTLSDVTERRRIQQRLREHVDLLHLVSEHIPEVFWVWDAASGRMEFVSGAAAALTGLSAEVLRQHPDLWLNMVHPEDRARVRTVQSRAHLEEYDIEYRIMPPHVAERRVRNRAVHVRNEGRVVKVVGICVALSQPVALPNANSEALEKDDLTGLPGRGWFRRRVEQACHRAGPAGGGVAVIHLAVDGFKDLNESLGHMAGDEVLRCLAERLLSRAPAEVSLARLGGDEFAALLVDADMVSRAETVARELMAVIAEPLQCDDEEVCISCCAGVAVGVGADAEAGALLQNASSAACHAKQSGRGSLRLFRARKHDRPFKPRLAAQLRRAVENEEFTLFYQPKALLANGEVTGVEALLRWKHPQNGLVLPGDFVPLLEETGLIDPVGEWVYRTASRQLSLWRAEGLENLRMCMNLSPRQLNHRHVLSRILGAVRDAAVPADCLEIEITESLLMSDVRRNTRVLNRLRAEGARIAVDDFGTGYSSLAYLKKLPVDTLKLDGEFVVDAVSNPVDASIVRSIIDLAHRLELTTVAERVETPAQVDLLSRLQCDEVQGYIFCRPLPADQLGAEALAALRLPLPGERAEIPESTALSGWVPRIPRFSRLRLAE